LSRYALDFLMDFAGFVVEIWIFLWILIKTWKHFWVKCDQNLRNFPARALWALADPPPVVGARYHTRSEAYTAFQAIFTKNVFTIWILLWILTFWSLRSGFFSIWIWLFWDFLRSGFESITAPPPLPMLGHSSMSYDREHAARRHAQQPEPHFEC